MIAVAYRRRARRVTATAFALSLLFHFTGAAMYGVFAARFPRLIPHSRPAAESFATLSQALTFDKHPRPAPQPASHPRVVARIPTTVHASVPVRPQRVVRPAVSLAHLPVVRVPKTERVAAGLSPERIARFNQDFTHAIAASRAANDPLRVPVRAASTIKRYPLQFQGRISDLRIGQGILTPIKKWFADGYTYYYVTYELVWPDGTYESGAVPWPIRYRPSEDPFASGIPGRRIPLPAPLSDWRAPAGIRLGKALREYVPGYKDPDA